jgi:hypothetical protein
MLALISVCKAVDPGAVDSESWDKGPLVIVAGSSTTKPSPEELAPLLIGYPAFSQLEIAKQPDVKNHWLVRTRVVSTNTGFPLKDIGIYVQNEGRWVLLAHSDSEGVVEFETSAEMVYISISRSQSLADGTILREYRISEQESLNEKND